MSDKWRRSLLGYNVTQFQRSRMEMEQKHRQAMSQKEAELTALRSECVWLRDQLSDLERELRAASRDRNRQGAVRTMEPASDWLRLRTTQEAAPTGDDDVNEP